jgi:phytoene dehydrogenase-like protein
MERVDAVVIGAGNAGLTAAAALAQGGAQVLVLERHNIPGGCATSFCRGRFEFEVALHQLSGIGTPAKPGPLRLVLDQLGIMDQLNFMPMHDLYHLVIPNQLDLLLEPDRSRVVETLTRHFPEEARGIEGFLDLVYRVFGEVIGAFYFKDPDVHRGKYPLYFKYGLKTLQAVLDEHIRNPLLQAALTPYWTYMGLPPSRLSFIDMAAMLFAYIEFLPFHLEGGSQALSSALAGRVTACGGRIRYSCPVDRILVEDGRVAGVATADGGTIRTRQVISNASKIVTFVEMLAPEEVPEAVWGELRRTSLSPSAFTLYLGLDQPPEALGITSSTNFILGHTDADAAYERMKVRDIDQRDGLMMTCYTLIDPAFSPPGTSQVALITLKFGDPWLQVPPAQYAGEKYRVAESMLQQAERVFPGLRDHVEEMEIATPVTHMRYLGTPRGAIYGFEKHIKDSPVFLPNRMHIEGLYLAGGWVGGNGFQPTLESGFKTGQAVLRRLKA